MILLRFSMNIHPPTFAMCVLLRCRKNGNNQFLFEQNDAGSNQPNGCTFNVNAITGFNLKDTYSNQISACKNNRKKSLEKRKKSN